MSGTKSWIVLALIMLLLLSGCSALAGDFQHYPASLPAAGLMIAGKALNDRYRVVRWPMEFVLWSAVTLIGLNLAYLSIKPF